MGFKELLKNERLRVAAVSVAFAAAAFALVHEFPALDDDLMSQPPPQSKGVFALPASKP